MVKSFGVIKDDMTHTHKVLGTTFIRRALEAERTFITNTAVVKKLYGEKVEHILEGKDGKERKDLEENELEKLHDEIDKKLDANKAVLDIYRDSKDLNAFYELLSSSIEKGWLAYLEGTREFNKQAKGRGKVTFITTKPKKQKEVQEKRIPNHTASSEQGSSRCIKASEEIGASCI